MKNIQYQFIIELNKAIRDISHEIEALRSGSNINSATINHLSERLSALEQKVNDLQNKPPSFGTGKFIAIIAVFVPLILAILGAYEWRIEAKLAQNNYQLLEKIDEKLSSYGGNTHGK